MTEINRRISANSLPKRAKDVGSRIIYNLKNKITLYTRYRLAQTPVN